MSRRVISLAALAAALTAVGCSAPNFAPASLVQSVRILATQADEPYAAPGDTVHMTMLAYDGRSGAPPGDAAPATPMQVYWLPQPCIDPPGDAFYACFPAFAALPAGQDLGPLLAPGDTFSFQMPADVVASHPRTASSDAGAIAPYGLAVVFSVACAGHVEYVPPPAGGPPDAVPLGCFDDAGHRLGADDFVFAYSLVYAFDGRTNANPVIQNVTYAGAAVDPDAGITVARCTKSSIDDCPNEPLDVIVPASSQERDPGDLDVNGAPLKEQIYVDYYVTGGKVRDDTEILYDPRAGRLSGTADPLFPPLAAGDYLLWAVVHDDRGGVAWTQIPLHAM